MKKILALVLLLSLTACGHGPARRLYPPKASVQELAAQADGHWKLTIRLQNFSNVPMTFEALDAKLIVADQDAGRVMFNPGLTVGPESADVITTTITPGFAAKSAVAAALAARRPLRYSLEGKITSRDPRREDDFKYDSVLDPVPGLNGVMR